MAYKVSTAPYVRAKKTTFQIMIELAIALAIVWVAAVVMSFIKLGAGYGIRAIGLMLVSVAVTAACDAVTTVLRNKKDKDLPKKILNDIIHNYSWITAMIFTLLCPVWTNFYVVIVGSIFATVIAKNVFGGFGRNIFNPAAMGRIFIQICFGLGAPKDLIGKPGLDATGATITSVINSSQGWLGSNPIANFKIMDILGGTYFGTMGEPFTLLLIVLGVVLAIRGVINWRAPVFYVGTVGITSVLLGFILGFKDPLMFVVYQLGLGGLMFGAVFMITDPVTTPTSSFGNSLIGIIAAFMTMAIRMCTNSTEGVVYSIALVNLITPLIDTLLTARTNRNLVVKNSVTWGLFASVILFTILFGWNANGGVEKYEINGLTIEEYEYLDVNARSKFAFMEGHDDYTFAASSKTVTNESLYSPSVNNGAIKLKSTYSVIDSDEKEVAVLYCIRLNDIEVFTGEMEEVNGTGYFAFSRQGDTKGKLVGIYFTGVPATSDVRSNVVNGVTDFDYSNDIKDAEPSSLCTGATYSAKGVKEMAKIAESVYASAYGAE